VFRRFLGPTKGTARSVSNASLGGRRTSFRTKILPTRPPRTVPQPIHTFCHFLLAHRMSFFKRVLSVSGPKRNVQRLKIFQFCTSPCCPATLSVLGTNRTVSGCPKSVLISALLIVSFTEADTVKHMVPNARASYAAGEGIVWGSERDMGGAVMALYPRKGSSSLSCHRCKNNTMYYHRVDSTWSAR